MQTHVLADGPEPPAGQLANRVSISGYDDLEVLRRFATSVDVATYEFENIPSSTIDAVAGFCPVRPGRSALVTAQDRLVEKSFLRDIGIDVAPFVGIENRSELLDAAKAIGFPAILKSRRFGYDGKGQARLRTVHDIDRAMNVVGNKPALLEQHVAFDLEISVIGARAIGGTKVCFGPGENVTRTEFFERPAFLQGFQSSSKIAQSRFPRRSWTSSTMSESSGSSSLSRVRTCSSTNLRPVSIIPATGHKTDALSISLSNTSGPFVTGRSATQGDTPMSQWSTLSVRKSLRCRNLLERAIMQSICTARPKPGQAKDGSCQQDFANLGQLTVCDGVHPRSVTDVPDLISLRFAAREKPSLMAIFTVPPVMDKITGYCSTAHCTRTGSGATR